MSAPYGPLSAARLTEIENALVGPANMVFSAKDYGAVGNDSTDDTAAIQAAFTAAIAVNGTVLLPNGTYKITDTITIGTVGGSQVRVSVQRTGGHQGHLRWRGAGSKPMFAVNELYDSVWNMNIEIPSGTAPNSLVVMDINGASTGHNVFNVAIRDNSTATGVKFWRIGNNALSNNITNLQFQSCICEGHSDATSVGFSIERSNVKNLVWLGGGSASLGTFFQNTVSPGTSATDFFFYGVQGTGNNVDYSMAGSGFLRVYGGRFETGKRFYNCDNSSAINGFVIEGVTLDTYAPADGIVFNLNNRPFTGAFTNLACPGTNMGANFFALHNDTGGPGRLQISGTVQVAAAATQLATITETSTGGFDIDWQVQLTDSSGQSLGMAPYPDAPSVLAYSATIATNAVRRGPFTIVATNGTAFTISNPTNPTTGKTITYDIKNSSGGAMGAITWGAAFLLAGAFTNPANTKRRTISFYFDGTSWIETNRAAADI